MFNFLEGRWRLTDAVEKYRVWKEAVGEARLAERLFTVALNLAEDRRGGLFVVLDDAATAGQLVAAADLLSTQTRRTTGILEATKNHLHYLLRGQRALDLAPAVLETVARIDGAVSASPPVVDSVAALKRPFQLAISGSGFRPGAAVYVGDDAEPWSPSLVEGETSILVGGGKLLKRRLPKGVAVRIRVVNPDGGEAETSFTR